MRRRLVLLALLVPIVVPAPAGAGWSGFVRIGNSTNVGLVPQLTVTPDGIVHAVIVGTNLGLYTARRSPGPGGSWSSWSRIGGANDVIRPETIPGVAATPDGVLHVVVTGVDDRLYHNRRFPSGSWSGWKRIGTSNDKGFDPAVTAVGDDLVAGVIGTNDGIYVNRYDGGWGGWSRVGSSIHQGFNLRLTSTPDGGVHLVITGIDDAPYASSIYGSPSGWRRVGGSTSALALLPAVTGLADNRVMMVVTGIDDRLYAAARSPGPGGGWSGFSRIGSPNDKGYDPVLAARGSIATAVVTGTNLGLYAATNAGGWGSWSRVGRSFDQGQPPALAATPDGLLVAVVVGVDLGLYASVGS